MIKQIPNIFTLLNLCFGSMAIVVALQSNFLWRYDLGIAVYLPEKIYYASIFIALAAGVDFLDGFVARLCNATSEMGKQLDSLADVVSFGVAPGVIIFQFLKLAFAQQADGMDTGIVWLLPVALMPCAGAYRLARYNIDTMPTTYFKGLPIPAAGLLIASFPLLYFYNSYQWVYNLFAKPIFWYAVIVIISYLMISTTPILSLKFDKWSLQKILPFIILATVGVIATITLHWLVVPILFILYVILSWCFIPIK